MLRRWTWSSRLRAGWPVVACGLTLLAFWAVGRTFLDSYVLDLGSMTIPAPRHRAFLFVWTLLGSLAAVFLAVGLTRLLPLLPGGPAGPDRRAGGRRAFWWPLLVATAAFLSACAIRTFLLRGAPLTDDESAYRFMAQVLAGGRLWADSPPLKAFFDRVFMVNDGRFYAQYFVGWPALLAPGVFLGVTGYMNAMYSALTVVAIFGIVRRLASEGAARAASVIYLASPMLAVGAATEMAHPSCTMALAWSLYCLLRLRESFTAWWAHAGVAFWFGVAFLNRPTSALGIGIPILGCWLVTLARHSRRRRAPALVSFAAPAVLMAAVFFGVNAAQNGSALKTSYARTQEYMREVDYVNVGWSADHPPETLREYLLPRGDLAKPLANTTVALVRLTFDLFGSPLVLVLVGLAVAARQARVIWASVVCFVAVHFFVADSGVDTYGPVHFFELALPLLVLCGIGYARLREVARTSHPQRPPAWAAAVLASVLLVSLAGFVPVRLAGVRRVADNVNMPADAVRQAGLTHAVIFTAGLFTPQECMAPTRHFVYFRPNNDPALTNDILWVNHLGWEVDHDLMKHFPGRAGYLLQWNGCRPRFVHL
jgi:hypothetical protein